MNYNRVLELAKKAGLTFLPKEESPATRLARLAYQAGLNQGAEVARSWQADDFIVERIQKDEAA